MAGEPRIAPGTNADVGTLNALILKVIAVGTGGRPVNVMTTLARHRGLFRRWLLFAAGLMPGGRLQRVESELVILRVANNTDCEYERRHHERLGREAGLSHEEIARVAEGPDADGWSPRQVLLLRATDELHATRTISDELWADLRPEFSDAKLIEICMLAGHYEMLAMTLNALRVQPDPEALKPPPRFVQAILRRT